MSYRTAIILALTISVTFPVNHNSQAISNNKTFVFGSFVFGMGDYFIFCGDGRYFNAIDFSPDMRTGLIESGGWRKIGKNKIELVGTVKRNFVSTNYIVTKHYHKSITFFIFGDKSRKDRYGTEEDAKRLIDEQYEKIHLYLNHPTKEIKDIILTEFLPRIYLEERFFKALRWNSSTPLSDYCLN